MILTIIAVILILCLAIFIIITIVNSRGFATDLMPELVNINQQKVISDSLTTSTTLFGQSSSSVIFFVNYRLGDRTAKMKSINNYTPVLMMNGSFALEVSPAYLSSSSATSQMSSTTRLAVFLAGQSTSPEPYYINLPQLPQQTWVQVAILRDGRRFDVMYNDRLVASERLPTLPVATQSELIIGNTDLLGGAIHGFIYNYRLNPIDVAKNMSRYTDVNGYPLGAESSLVNLPFVPTDLQRITTECPPGLPCNTISEPPQNPFKMWATPYN
jgi:hypothetical protein